VVPQKVEANERIRRTQTELGLGAADRLPFLCECDDVLCRTLVRLTPVEYESARSSGDRCIVVRGHPYRGRVVLDGDGYAVIEE
jgi:hypothetical protein